MIKSRDTLLEKLRVASIALAIARSVDTSEAEIEPVINNVLDAALAYGLAMIEQQDREDHTNKPLQ